MRLGVDFCGTKIEAALLDSQGEILVRERVPNPGSYDAAVRAVAPQAAMFYMHPIKAQSDIRLALEQYGIDVESFKRYAAETWKSEEWGRSVQTLARAATLLRQVGPQLVRLRPDIEFYVFVTWTDANDAGSKVRVIKRRAALAGLLGSMTTLLGSWKQ